jgi:hypothetical protein
MGRLPRSNTKTSIGRISASPDAGVRQIPTVRFRSSEKQRLSLKTPHGTGWLMVVRSSGGVRVVKPIVRQSGTTGGRTAQRIGAGWAAGDLDLAARKRAAAQDADALIIERMPVAPGIGGLEDGELLGW